MTRTRLWYAAVLAATAGVLADGTRGRSQVPTPPATPAPRPAVPNPTRAELNEAKKQIAELSQKVDESAKAAADARKAVEAAKAELAAAKADAAAAKKAADDLAKASADAAAKADALTAAVEAAKADAAAAKKAADDLAAAPKADAAAAAEEAKKAGAAAAAAAATATQRGDTAWILTSTAVVLFMVPGLALFYGGMVRRKNVLATMMQSMAALAVVGVYWVAVGYALAFGPSVQKLSLLGVEDGGVVGWSWDLVFMKGVAPDAMLPGYNIPVYVHMMFQGMFAIITPALISGAVAERIRFWPFCIFMILWISFVYCPLAHMVWAFDWFDPSVDEAKRGASAIGFLGKMGALDFAGGTVVHIAAGFAGLACALVLGRRDGYPKSVAHPNSMVLTLLGAGMLWFGWFGFNGGSALNSGALGGSAFAATQAAAAAAGLGWMVLEWLHRGKPTALGLASGVVAGLVAVTPAAGFVYMWGGLAIGLMASAVCYLAVWLKGVLGYDDSLDAFGVHGVGGFAGAVLTGVFCSAAVQSASTDGFLAVRTEVPAKIAKAEQALAEAKAASPADPEAVKAAEEAVAKEKGKTPLGQTVIQVKASVFSAVLAFVLSLLLCLLTQAMTLGNFRTSVADETTGLDQTEHGEAGFDFGFATQSFPSASAAVPKAATAPKGNGRFELVVEGTTHADLMKVWSNLAQASDAPADPDFVAVYPAVTTIRGTTFNCRGGDPAAVARRLDALFRKHLPGRPIKVMAG